MMRSMSGRGWAYVGAGLGGVVSIAANVAHSYVPPAAAAADWTPPGGAVVGAVFWPVALFVAVEILARVDWPAGLRWAALRFGGLLPVAGVAAFVSYKHLSGLLGFYGEDPLTATLGPLAVDGLMVMATSALLATVPRTDRGISLAETLGADEADDLSSAEAIADPWQYAVPIDPEPVKPKRSRPRSLTAAERVKAAHDKNPAATHARIAKLADVSPSTVKRHRPTGSPSGPPPAERPHINGNLPDLEGVRL